jgi:hypothetical protein
MLSPETECALSHPSKSTLANYMLQLMIYGNDLWTLSPKRRKYGIVDQQ